MISRPLHRAAVLLAAAALSHLVLADDNAPCYTPDGDLAPGYYPCDPTAFITNCCAPGWTCFSNSMCVVTTPSNAYPNLTLGTAERSMCTNPKWNNDICGDFCITGDDNTDGEMVACGDNKFCCLGDYNAGLCDCSTGGGSFVVNDGRAQTIVGETATFTGTVSYLQVKQTVSPTTPSSAASSATSSSTAPPSSSMTASSTWSSITTVTASGNASATAHTDPSTDTATPTPAPKSKSHVLAIGLGVGLGVGAVALGAGYFAWRRRHGRYRHRRSRSFDPPRELALDHTEQTEELARNRSRHGLSPHFGSGLGVNDSYVDVPLPPQTASGVSS